MKGATGLASGMLVLAAVCSVPAVSAAQDVGTPDPTATTNTTTTTTTATTDLGTSTDPAPPASSGDQPASPVIAGSPPADAPAGGAHKSSTTSVTMADFFFSASSITIHVGDTVTWRNTGQAPHTATAKDGSFDTGTVNPGGSGSHTFNSAGTFSYVCTIHPNMHGTIRVLSASGGSGQTGGGGGSVSSSSAGPGPSEAQAVNSPNAAGSSSTLPATGMAVGALVLVGLALLGVGLLTRRAGSREGELL